MSKRIKEITTENFSAAVDYAYRLNKKLHANVLATKIVLPLGTIVFALHALVLFLGAIYTLVQNNDARIIAFNNFGFIVSYWTGIWGICQSLSDLVYIQIILMVLFLFMVPFVISSIAAIIISCATKGKSPAIEGNTAQKAKQLYKYLYDSPRTYFEAFDGKPVDLRRITGIVSGILVIVFMLYFSGVSFSQSTDYASAFSVLFQSGQHSDTIILCLFCGVLFYVPYTALHYIFTKMIQPYCDSYMQWHKYSEEAERYWLSVDKDEQKERELKKLREEEEKKRAARSRSSSSSSYSSPSLTFEQKLDYINRNFGGNYSFAAIEYIRNDPSLSPSEKEELIIFLRAYG